MPARAWATTRSAAAICSSSARTSGSSAFRRASQLATATSASCRTNNASRSGCTLPPCMLENFPRRTLRVSFSRQRFLLQSQAGLVRLGGEIDLLLLPGDVAIQAPRLQPIHRALEHRIGLLRAETLELLRLERTGGRFIQAVRRIVREGVEERSVDRKLEVFGIDNLDDPGAPLFACH